MLGVKAATQQGMLVERLGERGYSLVVRILNDLLQLFTLDCVSMVKVIRGKWIIRRVHFFYPFLLHLPFLLHYLSLVRLLDLLVKFLLFLVLNLDVTG